MAAAIWIVAESSTAVETAAILLRPLGDVWTGLPTPASWTDAPAPDLLVLCAEDEPAGELRRLERALAFVSSVTHPRRAPAPILFVVPDRGHPGADLARRLIDDRMVETLTRPSEPNTLTGFNPEARSKQDVQMQLHDLRLLAQARSRGRGGVR